MWSSNSVGLKTCKNAEIRNRVSWLELANRLILILSISENLFSLSKYQKLLCFNANMQTGSQLAVVTANGLITKLTNMAFCKKFRQDSSHFSFQKIMKSTTSYQ